LAQNNKVYLGLDGFQRSRDADQKISLNIASLFATPSGEEVLSYLRSITIEQVNGAGVSDAELRHMEGQRYIVGLIESRIRQSHRIREND
jgi:hypothetical protein